MNVVKHCWNKSRKGPRKLIEFPLYNCGHSFHGNIRYWHTEW